MRMAIEQTVVDVSGETHDGLPTDRGIFAEARDERLPEPELSFAKRRLVVEHSRKGSRKPGSSPTCELGERLGGRWRCY
jgi:hypothetical protein